MQVRDCVPELPHVPEKPLHALHAPHEVAMHIVPSVLREHACICVCATAPHAPPAHVMSMHVRLCVPLVPHVPEKPPHAP